MSNPRLITFGEYVDLEGGGSPASVVDLGIVTNAAIFAANNYVELIPYKAGRFIKEVWFEVDGWEEWEEGLYIFTPNINPFAAGYANVQQNGDPSDTNALIYAGSGVLMYAGASPGQGYLQSGTGMIADCGPLYASMSSQSGQGLFVPFLTWQASTKYPVNAVVYGDDGNIYHCSAGGTSGTAGPPPTDDGTVTWDLENWIPGGAIRAKALIYDTTDDACTYPATIEFVQQPTDVVAEATIDPPITVRLLDQNGDPYAKSPLNIMVQILGAGTLTSSNYFKNINTTTGIATFDDFAITEPATGYTLVATCIDAANVARVVSDPFDVTAP